MTLFERENALWVQSQVERIPHRYHALAVERHEMARQEAYANLLEQGLVEHIAATRCYALANTRLREYVEKVLKTVGGECVAPPVVKSY